MGSYYKFKNKYYISANSSLADDRTMVLKGGDAFGVFDRYGDIHPVGQGAQGLYCDGTRFVSTMEMLINGERPIILSSTLKEENELLNVDLTNSDFKEGDKIIFEKGTLHIHKTIFIWNKVCYQRMVLSHFGLEPFTLNLSLEVNSDFSDIFEIRGIGRAKRGRSLKVPQKDSQIQYSYLGLDKIKRTTTIRFNEFQPTIEKNKAFFEVCLLPKQKETIEYSLAFETGNQVPEALSYDEAYQQLRDSIDRKRKGVCKIVTSNDQFNEWLSRSEYDLITMITETNLGPYPYAGVPWYSTPFGRDGIITAWECLWLNPELTKGVLQYLAHTQASELNDFQDAEPGKIFHERRGGEMAELGEIPFKLYYGTIDATPLFISLAGAYFERTGDIETIRNIWPNILRALDWINIYGDLDGDGFVEYSRKSEKGLLNQGWKDSEDSVFHEDGKLAEGSIALCEVQGYVYDAKIQASFLAKEMGDNGLSHQLLSEAETLKEKFAASFWCEEKNTFAIALDGDKRPCKVSTSNAGHCLFSGIVKPEHAERLASTLLADTMFSQWGIRTAASNEARYNPMSYHNGSVWPHDNAMIAFGLYRYGFISRVHKVLEGLFEVSKFVESNRLPELFCGFPKRRNEGPTAYPVACSPQAWAVASVYMLLQSTLGLKIVARENIVYFENPRLPHFLHEVIISNLYVNDSKLVIQIRKNDDETTSINVLYKEGDVKIKILDSVREEIQTEA